MRYLWKFLWFQNPLKRTHFRSLGQVETAQDRWFGAPLQEKQKAEVRGQRSEVRGRRSEVGGRRSENGNRMKDIEQKQTKETKNKSGFVAFVHFCPNPQSTIRPGLRSFSGGGNRATARLSLTLPLRRIRNPQCRRTHDTLPKLLYLMIPTLKPGFIAPVFGLFEENSCNCLTMNILHKNGRLFNGA